MKEPAAEDKTRCLDLRKRAKKGEHLTSEDMKFCTKMFRDYGEWYAATEKTVFNETVPFGSNARRE